MKNYRNLIVLTITVFALLFAMSCSAEIQDMRIRDTAVGPAESVLDGYTARNPFNGTDWRVLQKLALAEFTEMAPLMGYSNGETLARLPYPVLDREGKVAYWEFRIMRGSECRGFVACVGDKRMGEPVQYISPIIRDYGEFTADSEPFYAGSGYPAVLLADTEKSVAGTIVEEQCFDDLTPEQIAAFQTESERIASIWGEIDGYTDEILSTSDSDIVCTTKSISHFSQNGWDVRFVEPYASNTYFISTDTSFDNPYKGCGVVALAIVMGGYNKANGIGHQGDFTYFNGVRQELCNIWPELQTLAETGIKTKGVTWIFSMRDALEKASDGKLTITLNLIHTFSNIKNALERNDLPVISLRTGKYVPFIDWAPEWHYRVILGTAEKSTYTEHSFLWLKWKSKSTSRYYYCADLSDNGKSQTIDKPWMGVNADKHDFDQMLRHESQGLNYWEKANTYGINVQFFEVKEV